MERQIEFKGEAITIDASVIQEEADPGMWATTIDVVSNSMGSIALFVINDPLDTFLGTASPEQEGTVPVYPQTNDDGEARISTIKFRHAMLVDADGAVSGAMNDLEEYLRSRVIFRDHMDKQSVYTIGVRP